MPSQASSDRELVRMWVARSASTDRPLATICARALEAGPVVQTYARPELLRSGSRALIGLGDRLTAEIDV